MRLTKSSKTIESGRAFGLGHQSELAHVVWIIRRDGSVSHLNEDGELSGEDVIPGFRCSIREILPPPEPAREVEPNGAGPK